VKGGILVVYMAAGRSRLSSEFFDGGPGGIAWL
jgi:hypothetical protein